MKELTDRVADYFSHTTIHGLRYITEKDTHFIEKLFWTIICLTSVFGTWKLFQASLTSYNDNPISFTTETTYLDWNTTFPAVSVCEVENPEKLSAFGKMMDSSPNRDRNLDNFYRDIVFFGGTCGICDTHCGTRSNCTSNFTYLVNTVRASCSFLIKNCSWRGEPFDCCSQSKFEPLETEWGVCYTINSLQKNGVHIKGWKLYSNRVLGPGKLTFEVHEDVKVFIHSPEDVPFINHPDQTYERIDWGSIFSFVFQVTEIDNDPDLKEVPINKRNCRFPHENNLELYPYYSYSACVVECHAYNQMKKCNCRHHLMPKQSLICLTKNAIELASLKSPWDLKPGLVCSCMSSCAEQEFRVLQKMLTQPDDLESSLVIIEMKSLPSQRFKRTVVRSRLDLVVSMGSSAALFLGASLLSTVEFVYYWFRKRSGEVKKTSRRPTKKKVDRDEEA